MERRHALPGHGRPRALFGPRPWTLQAAIVAAHVRRRSTGRNGGRDDELRRRHEDSCGQAVQNESLGDFVVNATDDPRLWDVTAPALDARSRFESGSAIAVTAVGPGGGSARNVVFRLQTPRYANESTRCGTAFSSASTTGYYCPSAALPPGGEAPSNGAPQTTTAPVTPSPAVTTPRAFALAAVRLTDRCSTLRVAVSSPSSARVTIGARTGTRRLASWRRTLHAGRTTLALRLSRRDRGLLRRGRDLTISARSGTHLLGHRTVRRGPC